MGTKGCRAVPFFVDLTLSPPFFFYMLLYEYEIRLSVRNFLTKHKRGSEEPRLWMEVGRFSSKSCRSEHCSDSLDLNLLRSRWSRWHLDN